MSPYHGPIRTRRVFSDLRVSFLHRQFPVSHPQSPARHRLLLFRTLPFRPQVLFPFQRFPALPAKADFHHRLWSALHQRAVFLHRQSSALHRRADFLHRQSSFSPPQAALRPIESSPDKTQSAAPPPLSVLWQQRADFRPLLILHGLPRSGLRPHLSALLLPQAAFLHPPAVSDRPLPALRRLQSVQELP